ncbi:carbohydrate ABC transporter permease [Streptomyces luteolus]|uniref:Sugar ABC transporter permease n=1 Tax=Streptomyces luteolus TaxID=3043615 RepID=A0ABT6T3M5_9ACTN|nr:sugar ABC transporter permease [Streptomyces sp. B-S-A12]MDI3422020.1 sugar ABC transporter permease [Streptomyces sp. B-S-A12]
MSAPAITRPGPERAATPPPDPGGPRRRRRGAERTYYLMLIPAVLLFTVFITMTGLVGMFYSFTDYAGFGDWEFVGLSNYTSMLGDSRILESYGFTLWFAVVTTVVVNAVALLLAIGLGGRIRWKTGLRGVYFIPMVISGIVIAYVFNHLFSNAVPALATHLGWEAGQTSLLANESWAWLAVVIVTAWQATPSAMIIYLAGLMAVPKDIYEAAELDGAGPWRRFRSITFPLLIGYVVINTILGFKGFLNAYDIIVGLTGGGPGTATMSVAMTIFGGFEDGEYAFQMANAVVFFLFTAGVSLLQLLFVRNREVNLS